MRKIILTISILTLTVISGFAQTQATTPDGKKVILNEDGTWKYEATQQAITEKTIYQLLQGKWQSADDPKSVIEFKDQYYARYYDNVKGEENKFWLDKSCPDTDESGNTGENEKYLVVDGLCWFINDITESHLDLTYTSRGNTLIYKKIK